MSEAAAQYHRSAGFHASHVPFVLPRQLLSASKITSIPPRRSPSTLS